jgi:hypothetical protein
MELKDIARRLLDEIWDVFEPLLPPINGGGRKKYQALVPKTSP